MQVPVSCSCSRRGPLSRHPNEEAGVRGAVSSCLSAIAPEPDALRMQKEQSVQFRPCPFERFKGKNSFILVSFA